MNNTEKQLADKQRATRERKLEWQKKHPIIWWLIKKIHGKGTLPPDY